MNIVYRHTFCVVLGLCLLSGCALYPAVQVGGAIWTGYDSVVFADDYIPRQSVAGGKRTVAQDHILQRRLRERLSMKGFLIAANVIDGKVFMVGRLHNQKDADKAIKIARSVEGVKTVTCKFYPLSPPDAVGDDLRLKTELDLRLHKIKRFEGMDLRVEVIDREAILMGRTDTYGLKAEAAAVASEMGELRGVVDYIIVPMPLGQNGTLPNVASN